MKRYVFYLRPKRQNIWRQSSVYFSVIIAATISQAITIFSNRYHFIFDRIDRLTATKFQINFKDDEGEDQEQLTYVVVEEKKSIFDKKR